MAFEFQNNKNNADTEKAWNSIGKMIASGIGVGLSENSYLAVTAMENVYVELETLSKNAAKNAEKLAQKRQKREVENLKNARELELITEKEYYEKLKKYRDENLRQGSDSWYKYTEEIAAYNKRLLEEQEKEQREIAEKILQLRTELAEKLKRDVPWTESSKVRFKGLGMGGTDLVYSTIELENFKEEISLLERFNSSLEKLQQLGNVPEGIFADIAKMDIEEALENINVILTSDKATRDSFFQGYETRTGLAESLAGKYNGLLNGEELKKEGIYSVDGISQGFLATAEEEKRIFISKLEESFEEIPQSYYELGGKSGTEFTRGFMDRMPQLVEEVRVYMLAEASCIAESISAALKDAIQSKSGDTVNSYSNTYNFNSSKETTTQQLSAARNATVLQRLRGGAYK